MRAFSLVELSIVLVILGLLTGGILAGQSLIRAAELRSIVTEYQKHLTATQTFRDKFLAIPGDMREATRFWGKNTSACNGDPGDTGRTCNGNGDGIINMGATSTAGITAELFQFWNQLALAGLVEGSYTGLTVIADADACVIGTNCPSARLGGAGWGVHYSNSSPEPTYALTLPSGYGNYLAFGAGSSNGIPINKILKPDEAWNIDTKLDDGHPARGRVVGRYYVNACTIPNTGAATTTNLDVSYNLSVNTVECALYFLHAF